ncbi:MAG: ThuA domain-containing protein [Lentisphaeraceae bacterium]|nr:ThuA domain-containing protein [Lentisphaeraceae bacterium]
MKYFILSLILLTSMAQAEKIVFLHGGKSHGPGVHEYRAGSRLLADQLRAQRHAKIETQVIAGWPQDESVLDDADAIILYTSSSKIVDKGLEKMHSLWKKGVGMMMIHYALHPKESIGEKYFLPWIGGYFKSGKSVNPVWKATLEFDETHPISNGVGKVEVLDEWYFNMKFSEKCSHVACAEFKKENLKKISNNWNSEGYESEGKKVTLIWSIENDNGARGVGFTGGHYHKNWAYDNFRKTALNAILWIAKVPVPATGAELLPVTEEILSANTDDKSIVKLPTEKSLNFKPGKFETPAEMNQRMVKQKAGKDKKTKKKK